MYNIIHLLKCSSPALAQHFEESENSLKKLNEISIDFEKRLHNLEGEIGQRSLSRVGTLNAQSTDNVYTGENYPFLDDESSKYALIIVDGKGAKFIRFITGTHTFLNVKIVWSNNTLTIGANPDTNLNNYAVVIVGDWIDEGLGRFYEEYCKLYNKLYATIDTNNLIMKYIGTGTTGYEGTVDISKIPNFVDELTSGKLTLTLVKDNHYISDSLINNSTFVKTGNENAGSFYKRVQVDDNMQVIISCDNVYADNAKLSLKWHTIV